VVKASTKPKAETHNQQQMQQPTTTREGQQLNEWRNILICIHIRRQNANPNKTQTPNAKSHTRSQNPDPKPNTNVNVNRGGRIDNASAMRTPTEKVGFGKSVCRDI
jgi:hypothetical protein